MIVGEQYQSMVMLKVFKFIKNAEFYNAQHLIRSIFGPKLPIYLLRGDGDNEGSRAVDLQAILNEYE